MMTKEQADYLSHLLRLWRLNGDEDQSETSQPVWQASLEDPHTGERHGFANLEMLFAFLEEKTGGFAPGAQPQARPGPSEKGGGARDRNGG